MKWNMLKLQIPEILAPILMQVGHLMPIEWYTEVQSLVGLVFEKFRSAVKKAIGYTRNLPYLVSGKLDVQSRCCSPVGDWGRTDNSALLKRTISDRPLQFYTNGSSSWSHHCSFGTGSFHAVY